MLRRRAIIKKPLGVIDTSPKIAEYGKVLDRNATGVIDEPNGCYTDWCVVQEYVVDNVIITNISAQNFPYQFERKNGVSGWWYGSDRAVRQITRIRFSLTTAQLESKTSYAYSGVTGEVFFADRNSPYWGKQNIND